MFKVIANVKTIVVEQLFSRTEKVLAIQTANRLKNSGHSNVRLLSYESSPPVFLDFESPPPQKQPVQKVYKVASAVTEFDLPAPTTVKKRVTKRERSYGAAASRRSLSE